MAERSLETAQRTQVDCGAQLGHIERRRSQLHFIAYFLIVALSMMVVLTLLALASTAQDFHAAWETYYFRVLFLGLVLMVVLYIAAKEREQRLLNRALAQELVDARLALELDVNRLAFSVELSDILADVRDTPSFCAAAEQAIARALTFYGCGGGAIVRILHEPDSDHSINPVLALGSDSVMGDHDAESVAVHISTHIVEAGGPLRFGDGSSRLDAYLRDRGVDSAIGIPLRIGGRLHSVLCLWMCPSGHPLESNDLATFRILAHGLELALDRAHLTLEKDAMLAGAVRAFARIDAARHPSRAAHGERVGKLAMRIGQRMQLPDDVVRSLRTAGLLHDVGLSMLPEGTNPDARDSSDRSWRLYRQHPYRGAGLLDVVHLPRAVVNAVWTHHERYDGRGYPRGVANRRIPIEGRILAVADYFDATTSGDRRRRKYDVLEALARVREQQGARFDPDVVDALTDVMVSGAPEASVATGRGHAEAALEEAAARAC